MTKNREIKRQVTLNGLTPIMFDRYSGNNKEQLSPMDKAYFDEQGYLVLPSTNILSFLSATNTESATQRVIGRGYKAVAKSALSYVVIEPFMIPITRNGKRLTADDLKMHYSVARLAKGIPNPKERPLLETDWSICFSLTLQETPDLNEPLLRKIFELGGNAVGLGTFRGVFGKFKVGVWE